MAVQIIPILWPDEHQYARFREVCGGKIPPTLEQYQFSATDVIKQAGWGGLIEEVAFDPEDLRIFAEGLGEEVHSQTRRRFALHLWQERRSADYRRFQK